MVAKAILIRVRPVQFTSSDALTKFNCLEHGAIAVGPSADVVYLARARLLIELVERANEIRAVNIVARLFAFVAEDGIRRAGCGTSLDTRGTRATACQNDWAPTNSRRGSRPYAFRNSGHIPALTHRRPASILQTGCANSDRPAYLRGCPVRTGAPSRFPTALPIQSTAGGWACRRTLCLSSKTKTRLRERNGAWPPAD